MISKPKAKPSTKRKLPSGTTARALPEWIGKSPDTPVPDRVQLRILERQHGKCAITGHKFRVGDKKSLDHKIPAADGGENREGNRQWILTEKAHKPKTKAEAKVRKGVRKRAKTHAGIRPAPKQPLASRNDLPQKTPPKVAKVPFPSHLPSQLERLYGIRAPTKGGKR
jgi:5-methylcytosine-specific restriction enzyme A